MEGFEEATDRRRGAGTYQAIMRAMEILKRHRLPFGASCCYTSQNVDSISSEAFIDHLVDCGAKFAAWVFTTCLWGTRPYQTCSRIPHSGRACTPQDREYRSTKPIFTIDFQNDGQYVGGCIAGGRNYLHINANGDIALRLHPLL